jgi:hypothetical protein
MERPRWEPPVTPENLEQWKQAPWPQVRKVHTCHLFINGGQIQYCGDSTHALAGQTIPMVDFDTLTP